MAGESRPGRPGALRIAAPLAMAALLSITFVSLLVVQARRPAEREKASPAPGPPPFPVLKMPDGVPYGPPTAKDPFAKPEKRPRHGGKLSRWNLRDLPQGWNEGIAEALHSFFEKMDYDPDHPIDAGELEKVRHELEDYLAQLGPEAVPTLGAILNAEGDFVDRRSLLYAIGNLGPQSPEATFVLRDFFVARYGDPQNRSEMIHAVKAMECLKNETSFGTLTEFIERGSVDPGFHSYRPNFIEALGEHPKREEALQLFVDTMHEGQLEQERNRAAQALGKIRSPDVLPELFSAVQKERYWINKQTMLGSIGKTGDPSAIPFLEDQARTAKESGVRLSAANAIKLIGTPQGDKALREIARDEADPEVRKRIEGWLQGKR